jgi:hypothetical protein
VAPIGAAQLAVCRDVPGTYRDGRPRRARSIDPSSPRRYWLVHRDSVTPKKADFARFFNNDVRINPSPMILFGNGS